MVAFATLFLGLVLGEQTVELLVGSGIARVELRVNDAVCAQLEAPPWRATCDLGERLEPRRMTAVGFDTGGHSIALAVQLLNVYRPSAEISLLIDTDPVRGRVLRFVARSALGGPPSRVTATLDGDELAGVGADSAPLPALNLAEPHLVRVEAEWEGRARADAEAVFGGEFGDHIAAELTAVPVPTAGKGIPSPGSLAGTIRQNGRPLRIATVEYGAAEVWLLGDPRSFPRLGRLAKSRNQAFRDPGRVGATPDQRVLNGLGGLNWRALASLDSGDRLRILWPWPETLTGGGGTYQHFFPSPAFLSSSGGIPWLLAHDRLPASGEGPPHLADAATVAGMALLGLERRRAIVLLLDAEDRDGSRLLPAEARHYLERIRVPLHVWRLGQRKGEGPDPWGEGVAALQSLPSLDKAHRRLIEDLRRQRIAWVEGSLLPSEISVDAPREPTGDPSAGSTPETPESLQTLEAGDALDRQEAAEPKLDPLLVASARRQRALDAVGTGAPRQFAGGIELRTVPALAASLARWSSIGERFATAWSEQLGLPLPRLDGTLVVVVPPDRAAAVFDPALEELSARGHAGGGVAVVVASSGEETEALLVHELAHLANERSFARPIPVWLEEGIAEWLAREKVDADGRPIARTLRGLAREATVGRDRFRHRSGPIADLANLADAVDRRALPKLPEWTALGWQEFVAPAARAERYALAGSFVRFLFEADPRRALKVRSSLRSAIDQAELDLESVLAENLGDIGALERSFRLWLVADAARNSDGG